MRQLLLSSVVGASKRYTVAPEANLGKLVAFWEPN